MESQALTQAALEAWVAEARTKTQSGRIPDYIPRLAAVKRRWLAVQIRQLHGPVHEAGDGKCRFTLMSVIKPLLLLFLLEQRGDAAVFKRVGVLPSDQPFHSLAQLTKDGGFPRNPMINSGAIALAGCLAGKGGAMGCETLRCWLNQLSGATLSLDEAMLASVRSVGNETNRSIAGVLAQAGYLNSIDAALDVYNHICCLSGTVEDLARIGMLLAVPHPRLLPEHQRMVNALMLTCGLYEASGEFAVRVGVPTKSGVSGALLSVVPGKAAIACYSPALDDTGSSIAGLFLLEQLTRSLQLNIFG